MGDAEFTDLLTCFVLASLHLFGGAWMLLGSLKDFRRERQRVDSIIRHLIRTHHGRVVVADLASYAEIPEEDAREYLERRSKNDIAFVLEGRNGRDMYFFGQQYWNN